MRPAPGCHRRIISVGRTGSVAVSWTWQPPGPCSAQPKIPLDGELAPATVKPAEITQTGDGSALFGGPTGQKRERSLSLGHLDWTLYDTNEADATGVDWIKWGRGPLADEAYYDAGTAQLHFYHLIGDTFAKVKMTIEYNGAIPLRYFRGTHTTFYTYPNR